MGEMDNATRRNGKMKKKCRHPWIRFVGRTKEGDIYKCKICGQELVDKSEKVKRDG